MKKSIKASPLNNDKMSESFALLVLTNDLCQRYGTPLIPYLKVAEDYLGYQTHKTAMAKYHDGSVDELSLVTLKFGTGRKMPIFVKANDLARYLLNSHDVVICN
ncbi:pyocin activator PrtN family protein [Shewanella sp. 10N.286.51.B8]|uniref:pyocin activator PrtN family protein n=1 Tax=Shewanella sp. 10N.286.51.B8 TaxID=3229708 RepID=UPI00354B40FD